MIQRSTKSVRLNPSYGPSNSLGLKRLALKRTALPSSPVCTQMIVHLFRLGEAITDDEEGENGNNAYSAFPFKIQPVDGNQRFEMAVKNGVLTLDRQDGHGSYCHVINEYEWMAFTKLFLVLHPLSDDRLQPTLGIQFGTSEDLDSFREDLAKAMESLPKGPKSEGNCVSANSVRMPAKRRRRSGDNNEPSGSLQQSEFDSRTEEGSATQYFQFYGSLFQQQNMLQDYTRTATYQRAIHENWTDFRDKVVLDVGAGSGILSFFAAQVGAKRVYAVEASSMAEHCKALVSANGLDAVISVLAGKIEEIELPEQVDVIVSEPMGYMLVNERMLESYVHARKFLRRGGRMFPSTAELHLALFSDEALFQEQCQRGAFWTQNAFHGVSLEALKGAAFDELFRQPVVDSWNAAVLCSQSIKWTFNFEQDPVEKLQQIKIPFELVSNRTAYIHGIASWFDVAFIGSRHTVWLSTAPNEPLTHWYQVRCMVKKPLLVTAGHPVRGQLTMLANDKQSYDLELEMGVDGSGQRRRKNRLDLKTPHFRYTGAPVGAPPGQCTESPSDQLNAALATTMANTTEQYQQYLYQKHGEPAVQLLDGKAL